jgi:multiple sugar transport system substrate-binding protein
VLLSRRSLLATFAALACPAAGCTAAGGTGTPVSGAGSGAVGPLSWFASSITQGKSDLTWTLRDAFERFEPKISVEWIPLPPSTDSMRSTLEAVLYAGSSEPDVFLGDVIWPAEFGAKHYALALDASLGRGFFNRFPAEVVKSAQYGNHVYAAPLYSEQGLLYYRRDILARNGIAPPTTWEQLVAASERLKAAGETTYQFAWQGAPYEGLTCNWIEYLADKLGPVDDPQSYVEQMGSAGALAALTFMQELITSGVSPPDVTSWQEFESIQAFTSGQAAFLRGWNSSWHTIFPADTLADKQAKVGIAPLPRFADTPGSPAGGGFSAVGGWSMYVNPRAAHRDAALAFISWMTDVSAQRILATQGGLIPANQNVRLDPRIGAGSPIEVARKARLVVRPANTPDYPAVTKAIYQNIHQALTRQKTPADSLTESFGLV